MLKVEQITKDFPTSFSLSKLLKMGFKRPGSVRALNNVSFYLPRGKILAVLGPNGAGKTTLLKIISSLILPDKGTVSVNGYMLGCSDEKIKSLIGLVWMAERSFYWRLTGRQNLEFFAALYGMDKKTSDKRINDLLGLFKVDYADKRFDSYSTGMKKHFALMRGLLHNPELLLLDEPTKSLDYTAASQLRRFIREIITIKESKTVIFTTHHLEEAEGYADLFLILDKGRMLAFATIDELRELINNPRANLGEIYLRLTRVY
jgi:ABC-2 type transport system ATP-binding protein